MTMTVTSSAAAKGSWAQIAKGKSNDSDAKAAQPVLKPGARGSLMCLCRGKVLTMLSHYGWLMVYGKVDHPSCEKHEGHVYVGKKDVEDGETLLPGDVVTFHLYVDEKGLGAERCSLEERAPSHFNANAAEFVPKLEKSGGGSMRADADEFVPGGQSMSADADEFVPWSEPSPINDVFARLSQVFASDDEDDEDDFVSTLSNTSVMDSDSFYDESGDSSEDDQATKWHPHVQAPSLKMRTKAKRSASPDGSTSAGTASDSEGENSCDGFAVPKVMAHEARAAMLSFRPPPGLSLPENFRPPPGLSLPWELTDSETAC